MKVVLREYLRERDISLLKLCRMTGLCYQTISLWTLGKTKTLTLEMIDKICYALGCKISDILEPEIPTEAHKIKRELKG
jgi:DNA-binding Xre family transcriptional regulator